jgi:hypothetical protein
MDAIYEATRRLEASFDSWKEHKGLPRAQAKCQQYMILHKNTLVRLYAKEFGLTKRVVENVIKDSGLIRDPDALIGMFNELSMFEEFA